MPSRQTGAETVLYAPTGGPYTGKVTLRRRTSGFLLIYGFLCSGVLSVRGQEPPTKPPEKPTPETTEKKPLPFEIQLLETRVRVETNGDSLKEVHTIVKIHNLLGARQFARISFDYNRAFQQVEIQMVQIRHTNGGTSELLSSAVNDAPHPAVQKFPAYQDVRVKSVRILGLQEGDTVEYRVITRTTRPPLAPHFWLEHSFDRSGQVLEERYVVDLPESLDPQLRLGPGTPAAEITKSGSGETARVVHCWNLSPRELPTPTTNFDKRPADLTLTTFRSWEELSTRIAGLLEPAMDPETGWHIDEKIAEKGEALTKGIPDSKGKLQALYEFVSQKIDTVDLPLGATGFATRPETDTLESGYATAEDKYRLFAALSRPFGDRAVAFLLGATAESGKEPADPSAFQSLLIREGYDPDCTPCERVIGWLDPSLVVAPFGMVPADLRGKLALRVSQLQPGAPGGSLWEEIPLALPFPSYQKVSASATISTEGNLSSKVKYLLRGDNELMLRVAFYRTPKDKWNDVASLLALSDGYRGQITKVTISDPLATNVPFSVAYELVQPKFLDWTKKPVRIPVLLPQIGLPDLPRQAESAGPPTKIDLGTPLDVDTQLTLRLPEGTAVQTPPGTSVSRDYATFSATYSATQNSVTASRKVSFRLRDIPSSRALDYSTFVHAILSDQAQWLTLVRPAAPNKASRASSPAPRTKTPPG